MKKKPQTGNWHLFLQLICRTRPSRVKLSAAIALGVVSTVVGLIVPLFIPNHALHREIAAQQLRLQEIRA